MKTIYEYLINYSFRNGQGSCYVTTYKSLSNRQRLEQLKKDIEKDGNLVGLNLIITNYQLMSKRTLNKRVFK